MINIAIIGGTGVYDPNILENITEQEVNTPYGSVKFKVGEYAGKKLRLSHDMVATILFHHT